MEKITKRLRNSCNSGIFHDSRADVATLMLYCNMLADKINELNDELQKTQKELEDTKRLVDVI